MEDMNREIAKKMVCPLCQSKNIEYTEDENPEFSCKDCPYSWTSDYY